jgi:LacI family repressor for deo operon, udp, cdd, tsx, nupC, and nupG
LFYFPLWLINLTPQKFIVIQGIEDTADEHGYATLVAVSNLEESKELKYLHMLRMNHVDGCISFFNTLDADYITQLSKKYPFVQCCELTIGAEVSHVVIDNEKAIYDVTSEFIENNHKTIAFISGNYYKYSEISRESGFIKAHLDHNLKLDKSLIVKSFYRYTDGAEAVKKIFSRDKTPTAIVCASDSLALGAISELKRMEINVGEEVMVIGFDDTSITEFYKPSISSVSQPRYELGKEAFDLIFQKLNNIDATNKKVILPHRIIHRESTGY